MNNSITPVCVCILDGFGCNEANEYNAITTAKMPNMDAIYADYPHTRIGTDGLNVGLPDGQMGNSEVGHMNIGGGRIVMQNLPKINAAIDDDSLKDNASLQQYIADLKASGGDCHIMGLLSDGGVHSHQDHIFALSEIISAHGIKIWLHLFLDGRDVPPKSAKNYVSAVSESDKVVIATLAGRYYAMDRDNRWDRVQLAYDAIISAKGQRFDDASTVVDVSYADGKTDEFVLPCVVGGYAGAKDGDGILMANFRSDRAREIVQTMVDESFDGFERSKMVNFSAKLGMVEYSDYLSTLHDVVFSAKKLQHTLGQVMADNGLKQLRIAETEKYAHVTFFFNGGVENEFDGESRILVPSPDVATYDLKPDMAAPEVTEKLVEAITSQIYDLIVVNFANMDMVGHTGDMQAAVKAAEQLDKSVQAVKNAMLKVGGVLLITADHGNAELMVDPITGDPHTAHTTFEVPFIVVGAEKNITLKTGRLCDIAPTALDLMGVEKPREMTGESLINR